MKLDSIHASSQPSFEKFVKIKDNPVKIQKFRDKVRRANDDILTLAVKKGKEKTVLYLFSGKHFDEFIKLTKKIYFRDLRTHIEKYMKEKPKKMAISKAEKFFNLT